MKMLLALAGAVLLAGASALAAPITYVTTLSGANEIPPTGSTGTGNATVIIDTIANTLLVNVTFAGLGSGTTAAHIHCCTATPLTGNVGVATQTPSFSGFPLGVTSGTYSRMFDLTSASTYNSAFDGSTPASQEATLAAGLAAGEAYLNIHTSSFPNGEIRGFLVPIPEPSTFLLSGFALAGLVLFSRKR